MPEFPFVQAGLAKTIGSVPGSTAGTTLTANASTNVKGSAVELTASTEFDAHWVMVNLSAISLGGTHFAVDLMIGAATEQVIIPDLHGYGPTTGATTFYLFPMFIPKTSRLSARCSASGGSSRTIQIVVYLFSGTHLSGGSGPSYVSKYGAFTSGVPLNVDPGGSAHTDSSWTELTSATDREHHWLCVSGRCGDGALSAATNWLVDIGIGSATEQEIIGDLFFAADTTMDVSPQRAVCFPYFVPQGSRLTARVRSSVTTDGDRDINIVVYGC